MPNFVAMRASSRRPASARPRNSSLLVPPYISAVSRKLIPASSASRTTLDVASASSLPPKLLQPRPTTDTSSDPTFRLSIHDMFPPLYPCGASRVDPMMIMSPGDTVPREHVPPTPRHYSHGYLRGFVERRITSFARRCRLTPVNEQDGEIAFGKRRPAARLGLSLVVSLIVVLVGMAWTWRMGQKSARVYHALYHASEELEALEKTA